MWSGSNCWTTGNNGRSLEEVFFTFGARARHPVTLATPSLDKVALFDKEELGREVALFTAAEVKTMATADLLTRPARLMVEKELA
jgi:hypothetical protein